VGTDAPVATAPNLPSTIPYAMPGKKINVSRVDAKKLGPVGSVGIVQNVPATAPPGAVNNSNVTGLESHRAYNLTVGSAGLSVTAAPLNPSPIPTCESRLLALIAFITVITAWMRYPTVKIFPSMWLPANVAVALAYSPSMQIAGCTAPPVSADKSPPKSLKLAPADLPPHPEGFGYVMG
jgi:hypothetical protein